MLHEILHW